MGLQNHVRHLPVACWETELRTSRRTATAPSLAPGNLPCSSYRNDYSSQKGMLRLISVLSSLLKSNSGMMLLVTRLCRLSPKSKVRAEGKGTRSLGTHRPVCTRIDPSTILWGFADQPCKGSKWFIPLIFDQGTEIPGVTCWGMEPLLQMPIMLPQH